VSKKREELADIFERIAHQALAVVEEKLPDARPGEASLIAAQAVDKMRLLREHPTTITRRITLTDDQKRTELKELLLGDLAEMSQDVDTCSSVLDD
jgi:hypothetical protein